MQEDLEDMVSQCIGVKLAEFNRAGLHKRKEDHGALNDLKLKVKAIEQSEKQLLDTMLTGGFNQDLLAIVNQKATQLKQDRIALQSRMEELLDLERETDDSHCLGKVLEACRLHRKKGRRHDNAPPNSGPRGREHAGYLELVETSQSRWTTHR